MKRRTFVHAGLAREATVRDFRMFFLSDGTATIAFGDVSAEQLQKSTCATMQLFGEVLTLQTMTRRLAAA